MRLSLSSLAAVAAIALAPLSVVAAERAASAPIGAASRSIFAEAAAAAERTAAPAPQLLPGPVAKSDVEDYAAHLKWQREFVRDSWRWHLSSTKLLMYVVLAIVAFGLFITYLQFTRYRHERTRAKDEKATSTATRDKLPQTEPEVPAAQGRTSFKASLTGLEISSEVIGLIVLALSLAFFYLYVKDVYPIQEIELQKQARSAETAPANVLSTQK